MRRGWRGLPFLLSGVLRIADGFHRNKGEWKRLYEEEKERCLIFNVRFNALVGSV